MRYPAEDISWAYGGDDDELSVVERTKGDTCCGQDVKFLGASVA